MGVGTKSALRMKILIKPRIHITLISMHGDGCRVNGGLGFAITEPKGALTIHPAKDFEFVDLRRCAFSKRELEQIKTTVQETREALKLTENIRVTFEGGMLTHYGMGSATAVRLGVLEALLRINKYPVMRQDLIRYSKRGGTSGIGINTYFDGQFVFDLGVKNTGVALRPSSKVDSPSSPLVLNSIDMPRWNIGLCIPTNVRAKTQEEETEFFTRVCPIPATESYKTLYHSLFGIYASIRDNDLPTFANAIKTLQKCEWKRSERQEYGNAVLELEDKLYLLGAQCVGMSSLGPMLFFICTDSSCETIAKGMGDEACNLIVTSPSNSGRNLYL